jgi:hypothetical protein
MKLPILVLLLFASAAYAQSGDADWQMYGKSSLDKAHDGEILFFDAAGILRRRDGHIEVWTKALPVTELRGQPANEQMTKTFIDFSKRKVANGYVPPLTAIDGLDAQESSFVMMYEAAANLADIKPTVQILFELDCTNRVMRSLSVHARNYLPDDTASEWQHEPPGTTGALLIKLLCK